MNKAKTVMPSGGALNRNEGLGKTISDHTIVANRIPMPVIPE